MPDFLAMTMIVLVMIMMILNLYQWDKERLSVQKWMIFWKISEGGNLLLDSIAVSLFTNSETAAVNP